MTPAPGGSAAARRPAHAGARTLAGVLRRRAERQPHDPAFVFLREGAEAARWTYAELDARARGVGALLEAAGARGGRVLLAHPAGVEFVAAFFGCLYAGAAAVPVPVPSGPGAARALVRLRSVAGDAGARVALTTAAELATAPGWVADGPAWLASDDAPGAPGWEPRPAGPDGLAFVQYTSGSTRTPRGVRVTHASLLHNLDAHLRVWRHPAESAIVSWLPHFHDLGLVYGIVHAVCAGCPCVLMAPQEFVERPARWLRAVSDYRATHSMGPCFGYELCVRKVSDADAHGLDLGAWRVAVVGAEPVRRATLERFVRRFGPHGFRRRAFCPGYGLAEATLGVTATPMHRAPGLHRLSVDEMERQGLAPSAAERRRGFRTLVGAGPVLPGLRVAIAHPQSRTRCAEGETGEIWVAGPSVAAGYLGGGSARTFGARLADTGEGPFLRTGDLGFVRGGEVVVAGRLKDVIIVRGRNVHPHDLEWTAERSHPALRPGCSAAFGVEGGAGERVVLAAEVLGDAASAAAAVRRALSAEHGVAAEVVPIRPGTLPKTSSGKVQRAECRARWRAGTLDRVECAPPAVQTAPRGGRARMEALLRAEVARLLRRASPEPDDTFTAMGLDSLALVQLRERLAARLGVEPAMTAFMDHPTVPALAEELLRLRRAARSAEGA